jgi:hypothetical protein
MRSIALRRPSPATVIALLALGLAAVGGFPGFASGGGDDQAGETEAARPKPSTVSMVRSVVRIPAKFFAVAVTERSCESGTKLIGGGAIIKGSSTAHLAQSGPGVDKTTWRAAAVQLHFNNSSPPIAGTLEVWAICAEKGKPVVP